jgi:hypothetical protein
MADLDRCAECGSTMLVRALGETVCRACGLVRSEAPEVGSEVGSEIGSDDAAAAPGGVDPGFADEVAAALARVLKSSLR